MAVVAAQKKVSPSSSRLGMYPPEVSSRRLEDGWAGVESEAVARRRAELSGELLGSPPSPHVSCGSHSPRAASGASLSPREISPRISCSSQSHLQSPRISCSSLSPRTHNSNASSFVYDASPDAGYSPYSPVPPWTAARANDRSSVPASSYSPYPPAPASSLTPRSAVVISYPHGPGCSPAMNAATEAWSAVASSGAQAAGAAAAAAGAALQGLGGTGDAGLAASEDEVRAALAEESLDLALTLALPLTLTLTLTLTPTPTPTPTLTLTLTLTLTRTLTRTLPRCEGRWPRSPGCWRRPRPCCSSRCGTGGATPPRWVCSRVASRSRQPSPSPSHPPLHTHPSHTLSPLSSP